MGRQRFRDPSSFTSATMARAFGRAASSTSVALRIAWEPEAEECRNSDRHQREYESECDILQLDNAHELAD